MGKQQPVEFYNSEGKPARTEKLNQLARCVDANSRRVAAVEVAVGSISPSGTPGDPGDMNLWFENGLT